MYDNPSFLLTCLFLSATPLATVSSQSHTQFAFICTTTGAPATVVWEYASANLFYTDSNETQIVHSLLDGTSATYESILTFATPPTTDIGVHVCIATSTYISSDSSNTSTTTGKDKCNTF